MKNTLFRRAVVGTFAAAAAFGLSALFAAPASAHNAGPSGKAVCGDDGKYVVTWTVKNDFGTKVTLSNIKILSGGKVVPGDSIPAEITLTGYGKETFTTTYAGDTSKTLVLSVDGLWQDGRDKTWPENGKPQNFTSDGVKLTGDCKPDTPTPTPSKTTPGPQPSASKPAPRTPEASSSAPPGLPVTGSSSTLPMVGTGAALIAGGTVLVVTLRRRRRVTFTAE
ncbi:LPXTG cell wall anchor domain-containing protein [Dactylosporangium sp. CA-233914]|uniref:LPXTG cell wall anchor domain-containing protein n=1 Tax=Dactylosporangium sp. CA-233914 TaxID=3239934 RepID=UPI003D8FD067